jgi:hypothetical protein
MENLADGSVLPEVLAVMSVGLVTFARLGICQILRCPPVAWLTLSSTNSLINPKQVESDLGQNLNGC